MNYQLFEQHNVIPIPTGTATSKDFKGKKFPFVWYLCAYCIALQILNVATRLL